MPDDPLREPTGEDLRAELQRLTASADEHRAQQSTILAQIEDLLSRARKTREQSQELLDRIDYRRREQQQEHSG